MLGPSGHLARQWRELSETTETGVKTEGIKAS